MDSRLTDILVCPVCKGPLHWDQDKKELQCAKCALGFPTEGEIPVMLENEARTLTPEEISRARIKPVQH